jgi:hypothetical protein
VLDLDGTVRVYPGPFSDYLERWARTDGALWQPA